MSAVANLTSTFGRTLRFKGDLIADEDLTVQGRIEGSVLHSKSLTIGHDGVIVGNIRARRVLIDGNVDGDVYATDVILVRETAKVTGNLFAPSVGLQEGAKFKGRIDMENAPSAKLPKAPALSKHLPDSRGVELTENEVDRQLSDKR